MRRLSLAVRAFNSVMRDGVVVVNANIDGQLTVDRPHSTVAESSLRGVTVTPAARA